MDPDIIFNHSNYILYIWSTDPERDSGYISSNIYSLGYTPKAFLELNYLDLIHPDDLPYFLEELHQVKNDSSKNIEWSIHRILRPDGCYSSIDNSASIERDSSGKILFFHCILKDITSEEVLKKDLLEKKKRLELVLEGTRLGMWDWNPQTNFVHFDERWAEMLGYQYSEIDQNLDTWQSKVHPDDLPSCLSDIADHMEGKTDFYENVHRMKHRDGHWVYILDRGKIVDYDFVGKPKRFTGTHTDITREKLAEQKAMDAAKAKSFFLANMSHEIRTPLHGILGLTDVLKNDESNPEKLESINSIQESGESLLVIINDILDVTKLEEGKLQLYHTSFSLKQLLNDTVSIFQERFITKKLYLKIKIDENVPEIVETDKNRLRQVFLNFISNSVKFTSSGGLEIHVSREDINHEILIHFQFSDTGKGIDSDKLQIIFNRFSQENASISSEFGGTGLGLPISKQLIQLLGGEITVKSEINSGTQFNFSIKVKEGVYKEITKKETKNLIIDEPVLVVDDNQINLMVFKKMMKSITRNLDTATNGLEGYEKYVMKQYRYVFMDIHMPVMDGFTSLEKMKSHINSGQTIFISLTADAFEDTKKICLEKGFHDFLPKPFSPDDIKRILEKSYNA